LFFILINVTDRSIRRW